MNRFGCESTGTAIRCILDNALLAVGARQHHLPAGFVSGPTIFRARRRLACNTKSMAEICETRTKLMEDVQRALSEMVELIEREKQAVFVEAPNTIIAIDELIEKAFGRKERSIGALQLHREEHGC
jgi:hypothetical protein